MGTTLNEKNVIRTTAQSTTTHAPSVHTYTSTRVVTSDIHHRLARPRLRLLHYLIDGIAVFILYFMLALMLMLSSNAEMLGRSLSLVLLASAYFGYYLVMESHFHKTLGKLITKTQVINLDGSHCSVRDIFVRTLCRFIPIDNISFLLLPMGFHDKWSKTTVIHDP